MPGIDNTVIFEILRELSGYDRSPYYRNRPTTAEIGDSRILEDLLLKIPQTSNQYTSQSSRFRTGQSGHQIWWPELDKWKEYILDNYNPVSGSYVFQNLIDSAADQPCPDSANPSIYTFESQLYKVLTEYAGRHETPIDCIVQCCKNLELPDYQLQKLCACTSLDSAIRFLIETARNVPKGSKTHMYWLTECRKNSEILSENPECPAPELQPSEALPGQISEPLPGKYLTSADTLPVHADENTVLHREELIAALCEKLTQPTAQNYLLFGLGGVGKTSIARVLFSRLMNSFDSIGWVTYNNDLKSSLLASTRLCTECKNPDDRWNAIFQLLAKDPSRKLLFVDNVDRTSSRQSSPAEDESLRQISNLNNTTVVITSRMHAIPGYTPLEIPPLSEEDCIDLFYFYYDNGPRNSEETVRQLISLANRHTLAIELLAKTALVSDSLEDYAARIRESGFQLPAWPVATNYNNNAETLAANQLRKLFDMNSRTPQEWKILWDFAVLPANTPLSLSELFQIFGHEEDITALSSLAREGWLTLKAQKFSMHPLIREVIHFDLSDGKAPVGTAAQLIAKISADTLVDENMAYPSILRRLNLAESALPYLAIDDETGVSFYFHFGMLEFRHARKRLTALQLLEKALQCAGMLPETPERIGKTARIHYESGYIKSATQQYRSSARDDLQKALSLWERIGADEDLIAMAHDHLGYVLSDEEETFSLAQAHLEAALSIRKAQLDAASTRENAAKYATTCDNLGCLFARQSDTLTQAISLLKQALSIRESIYEETQENITDVAWTLFNIGTLLGRQPGHLAEAEGYLRRTLELRRRQCALFPGMYTTNIVFALIALAKVLLSKGDPTKEVRALLTEAIALKAEIDAEHTGFFSQEMDDDIAFLSDTLRKTE